jgi:hypothetical protein
MSRLHWLALLVILTALLLMMEVARAADLQMTWNRVDRDINGDIIDSAVEYRIYSMTEGVDSDFKFRTQTPDTIMVVPLQYPSCFSVYITAVRLDNEMESIPSNIASDCFYADNGEPIPDDPQPEPDTGQVTVPQPPQPTTLEMRIDG